VRRERPWLGWLPVAAGLVLWLVVLAGLHPDALGSYGLLPELPWAFWAALVLVVGSAVVQAHAARLRQLLLLGHLGVVLLVLYATAPAVEDVPRYTYTYKHIGITQYIERYGTVDKNIDIYHRWPGFFSLSAWFSQLAGLPDPTSYAAWAEPFFASLDALVVWACVQAVTRSARHAWLGALLFTVSNWVGQDYYSPQAFGFLLMLGVLLLVLVALQAEPGPVGRWVETKVVRWLRVRAPLADDGPFVRTTQQARVAGLVLLLDAVLAASHQLTPYVLLAQLGALVLGGYLRPWWVALGAAMVTIGYLVPNYSYVVQTFGSLLSAPDPLANATSKTVEGTPVTSSKVILLLGGLCFLSVFTLAFVGVVRRARRGHVRDGVVVAVLAFAPPGLLAAQSYGGEARLRVLLYALPWCCTAACWAWAPDGVRAVGRRVWAPLATAGWFTLCFVWVFFGHEDQHLLTPGEVGAAALLSDPSRVQSDSVVLLMAPNFPARYGPLYFRLGGQLPALSYESFGKRPLLFPDQDDVDAAAAVIDGGRQRPGYLVFSRGQENWARDYQLYPPYTLKAFEGAVASSPRFRIVYDKPTARIYELVR
jgi:hypothetical protein